MSKEDLIDDLQLPFAEFPYDVEQNWMPFVSFDGIPLTTYRIRAGIPRALLFYFHGYLSCSLEFVSVGYDLSSEGFECFSIDQRGHGQSGGLKAHFADLDHMVADAISYLGKIKEIYGDMPVFLMGSSMGGTIAIHVSEQVPTTGMVLFAPAVGVYRPVNCCLTMILDCFACCCPRSILPSIGSKPVITRNTRAMEIIEACPLNSHGINRAASIKALLTGIESAFRKARTTTTPFVIIQGGRDYVTSEPRAKLFFCTAASTDKDYWFYPEVHHAIRLEPEYSEIKPRLKEWLLKRLI